MKRRSVLRFIPLLFAGAVRGARAQTRKSMATIDLVVQPVSPVVLSGEALTVHTTVHNRGSAPVKTHGEMEPSSFTYRLEPQTSGRQPCVLSENLALVSLYEAPT